MPLDNVRRGCQSQIACDAGVIMIVLPPDDVQHEIQSRQVYVMFIFVTFFGRHPSGPKGIGLGSEGRSSSDHGCFFPRYPEKTPYHENTHMLSAFRIQSV